MSRSSFLLRVSQLLILLLLNTYLILGNTISFNENKGQWDSEIKYVAEIPQGRLMVMNDRLMYVLQNKSRHNHADHVSMHTHSKEEPIVLTVVFEGKNHDAVLTAYDAQSTRYNYYYGDLKGENCQSFESLIFENLYDDIDLKLYTNGNNLKYDLIVGKNGDLSKVKFRYDGNFDMYLEDGCSFVDLGRTTLMEDRPYAYQVDGVKAGGTKEVSCAYSLSGNTISFDIGNDYDPGLKLVIDPELIFSTFSGSVSDNFGYTACFDDEGNLYSGGIVFGGSFPTTTGETFGGGSTDIAILKYDSSGADLLYATFLGGTSEESPHSLIVNNAGELVIMGTTGSTDFPITTGAFDDSYNNGRPFALFGDYDQGTDIIVSKLNENGLLVASTFVGGPGNDGILRVQSIGAYENQLIYNYGDYQRGDVIVDELDNVYVASSTDSTGFPISSDVQDTYMGGNSDAVVFSLNRDLTSLRWSTYLGGTADDAAYSIKLTNDDKVLVGGGTSSDDFPSDPVVSSFNGDIDGFVSMIDQENDTLLATIFLGTSTYDQVYFIDIDKDQNIYAMGQTSGGDYPVTAGVYNNPGSSQFIHKLDSTLENTIFSTVFGSGNSDPNISPTAFLANECENIFVSGWGGIVNNNNGNFSGSTSTTFGMPITSDALFPNTDGSDFYLMVLSSDASELLYATFFGSTDLDNGDHVDGGTSRFDKSGIVYQSVCSCGGSDDDFPTTAGAWATSNASGNNRCNNAAFKFDLATLDARFVISDLNMDNIGVSSECAPFTFLFTNTSIGGTIFEWDLGDGTISTNADTIVHTYDEVGLYTITLTITDENTCTGQDITSKTLTIYNDQVGISNDVLICDGTSTQLSATGGVSYSWSPPNGLNDPTSASPIAAPELTTEYVVTIETPNGCIKKDSLLVRVEDNIEEVFEIESEGLCSGVISYRVVNETAHAGNLSWDFGNGVTSQEREPIFSYESNGVYEVNLSLEDISCAINKSITIDHKNTFVPNVFTPNRDNVNDYFVINSSFDVGIVVVDRAGKAVYRSNNYQNSWDGEGLNSGVYYYNLVFENGEECNGWVQLLK